MDDHPRRGDVFFAFLDPVLGCEQGGTRPVLVVQTMRAGTGAAQTIIVAAITGKPKTGEPPRARSPAALRPALGGLREGSVALLEQLRTIDSCASCALRGPGTHRRRADEACGR